jgi:hypothetical protein
LKWKPAKNRVNPPGGKHVARIPGTTATKNGGRIIRGFDPASNKGAGIRVCEYAGSAAIGQRRLQLEALSWLCADSEKVAVSDGMTTENAALRKAKIPARCKESGFLGTVR